MKKNIQNNLSHNVKQSAQHGFAMIEVLISVVILSVGLLGLAGLQVVGMKGTQHANMKTQATLLTQSLLEKIRANPNGDYIQVVDCSQPITIDCGLVASTCGVDELASYDLYRAQCGTQVGGNSLGGVENILVNGAMQVTCPSGNCSDGVTVLTTWDERAIDTNDTAVNGVIAKKLQLSAVIRN